MFLLVLFHINPSLSLDNGLARTPPMGWMSWQRYGCETDCKTNPDFCLSEDLIKRIADALVVGGYRDAGYEYVHIDDCWLLRERDAVTHEMVPDPIRFPSGMKALAEYLHARNLKLGIYSDIGKMTCQGLPGLEGNYILDALTFAKWEIDAIKVDGCYANVSEMGSSYASFGVALNKTGRAILYACSWPAYQSDHCENEHDLEALRKNCNLWRNFDDIEDSWESVKTISNFVKRSKNDILLKFAGPGGWNDPDMLLLGNPGLSYSEQEAQISLWAILAAPLYLSTDIASLSEPVRALAINPEIISISQDPLGKQGYLINEQGQSRIWARPLKNGAFAVLLQNLRSSFYPTSITLRTEYLGWPIGARFRVRDVLNRIDLPEIFKGVIIVPVDESSVRLFRVNIFDEEDEYPVLDI